MSTASRRRGQRLFGVLLGTLNKFKDDSEKQSEGVTIILTRNPFFTDMIHFLQDKKRQEIDTKLHEKLANEKKELAEKMQADKERREQELNMLRVRDQRILDEKRVLYRYSFSYVYHSVTHVMNYAGCNQCATQRIHCQLFKDDHHTRFTL